MLRVWMFVGAVWLFGNVAPLAAQNPRFVELVESDKPFQGKVVARNDEQVWLMDRAGVLNTLSVPSITGFRKLSDSFSPNSAGDMRDQLRRELGGGFEIVGTGHYLVAGPSAVVRSYAEIFEDQYRAVYTHFSVRGLDVHSPEFPLVAIVFPDAASFTKYAAGDKLIARPGLKGYYIQSTNRVALFHEKSVKTTSVQNRAMNNLIFGQQWGGTSNPPVDFAMLFQQCAWADTEGDMESTMIHEATHQVAFNIGIHSRIGNINPRWVVEGLATAFETPGMRSTSRANIPGAKLNQMRLTGFRDYLKLRRKPKSLAQFVESDEAFAAQLLDGYAQAWALSFFLIETRPREYARYIKAIAARPPLEPYADDQRLADFKSAFGGDLVLLESHFLRFIAEAK